MSDEHGYSHKHADSYSSRVPRPDAALPSSRPIVLLVAACATFAAWVGTQYTAYRLAYHPRLGPWLYAAPEARLTWWRAAAVVLVGTALLVLRIAGRRWAAAGAVACLGAAVVALAVGLGPVYAPYWGLVWALRYQHSPTVASVVRHGLWATGIALAAALSAAFAARPYRRRPAPSKSHGSAKWGTGAELLLPSGLMVGRAVGGAGKGRRAAAPSILRYAGDGHLLTVAPTRSGKGVSAVIPNLLTYPGSVVVTDPKGENYAVTRDQRERMGYEVVVLDPFGITGAPRRGFNPLDMIDPAGDDVTDDAMLLADMLVLSDGAHEAAFWENEARALLAGLILYVAVSEQDSPGTRTLPYVRRLLTAPPAEARRVLESMLECADEGTVAGELIARAAARHLQKADREAASVVSMAQSHTHFLDSPRMVQVLQGSGGPGALSLDRLKTDLVSLYLVLPAERLSTYQRWLRLMIACALLATVRTRACPRHRVLFLLDEFANLGRMGPVEDAISLVGGYGASFWLFLQDLSQLKAIYRDKWETFEGNVHVVQAFGVNDLFTAKHLSERLGDATIHVESENRSAGVSHGRQSSRQQSAAHSTAEKGRRLLTPDEVMRLPLDEQLLFVRGRDPVRARKLNYLADSEFAQLAGDNPMHQTAGAVGLGAHA